MNILYVLNSGNPGGVEQHVLDLVSGFIDRKESVFVWCAEGQIAGWYESAGAKVTTNKIAFEIDPQYILKLVRFIKDNKIDIVHAHELKAGVNATIAATIAGVKVRITHVHTPMSEWRISGALKKVQVQIETFFYAYFVNLFSSKEIALTESRKKIKMNEGIKADKLFIIPNGIVKDNFVKDRAARIEILQKYRIPDNAIIVGNIGRMTLEKGQIILVEAFAKVLTTYSGNRPLYLLLAGGGALEDTLKDFAKELGITDRVIITGIFNREDQQKYYSSFDIFVFPSLAEGFGLVLIEAMANELPVISSNLEVLMEVGGSDVQYFKSQDTEDLKNKITETLALSAEEKISLGLKLRDRVSKNYSIQTFIENYSNLYKNLLNKS